MFPFGSFISSIPLVVLATAYFVYFGASVFNRVKSSDVAVFAENESAKIVKFESSDASANVIRFHKLLTCESGIHNDVTKDQVFIEFSEIPHYFPESIICSYSGNFNLFSRPPPNQF